MSRQTGLDYGGGQGHRYRVFGANRRQVTNLPLKYPKKSEKDIGFGPFYFRIWGMSPLKFFTAGDASLRLPAFDAHVRGLRLGRF